MVIQKKFSKEAQIIFESMASRLREMLDKYYKHNINSVTPYAFQIGFLSDIEEALKKINKNIMPKGQQIEYGEIELKDIEEGLNIIEKAEKEKKLKKKKNGK